VTKFPPLLRLQQIWGEKEFERLSHFLESPSWQATNNAAECKARQFRHIQAPHFNWRSTQAIEGVLKAHAVQQMQRSTISVAKKAVSSHRGRRPITPQTSSVMRV
jgi:hypothetical protein